MSDTLAINAEPSGIPIPARYFAAMAILIGIFMGALDTSIVNVALPTIAKELDATPAAIIWVVNAYHVASAATMITFAAVGAVFSYRRVYCIGLAIFTLTSIGCAVANDLWTLVAFRSLQGFSYAAMVSIGIGMYRKIYPPELLGSILGINALIVALGTVAGPTLGGIIVSTLGWPWLFLINVPFGVAALYLGLRNLPADEGSGARLDLSSIGYSVLAIGFVVIAIDQAGRWDNGIVWTLLACGAVLATVFLRRQRRLDAPLLPLDIFASKRFSFAAAASLAAFSAQGISFVALPFLFQSVYGYSAIQSALLFTPWPVVVTVAAPLSGRLSDKINATLLSTIGVGIFALGLFLIASMDHAHDVTDILWRLGLCGLGFGFSRRPTTRRCSATWRARAAAPPRACWPRPAPWASRWARRWWPWCCPAWPASCSPAARSDRCRPRCGSPARSRWRPAVSAWCASIAEATGQGRRGRSPRAAMAQWPRHPNADRHEAARTTQAALAASPRFSHRFQLPWKS